MLSIIIIYIITIAQTDEIICVTIIKILEKAIMIKKLFQKYKIKLLFFIISFIIFSAYVVVTSWKSATYKEVQSMYPIQYSSNKEASKAFLKAMEYRIYIKELHTFLDYDNFIMMMLLANLNMHFAEGKALLPKDSVEDIVWWVLFYKDMYGLVVPPRNDNSLAYENLSYDEFSKVHDEVFEMIKRYPYGEVNFRLKEIREFRFQAMAILVEFYYKRYSNRYDGKNRAIKENLHEHDIKVVQNLKDIKELYLKVYNEQIMFSNYKNDMKYNFLNDMVYMSGEIIAKYIYIGYVGVNG